MLHLIPQMGKHWTTTSEASFPKPSLRNEDSAALLLQLQQQSLRHNSLHFPEWHQIYVIYWSR